MLEISAFLFSALIFFVSFFYQEKKKIESLRFENLQYSTLFPFSLFNLKKADDPFSILNSEHCQ